MRFSLLRKLFGRKNQPAPRRQPVRFRPWLEALEDRTLLSATLYVDNPSGYNITTDVAPTGLSNGDTVTWNPGTGSSLGGPVTGLIFGTNAFSTIQSAVNAANPGDTIEVGAGTYAEQITIAKSLTLEGAQAGVDARGGSRPAAAESVLSLSTYGLQPEADNITINGFKIVNAPLGSPNGLLQTYSNANSFTLENTILNDSARAVTSGVVVFGGGSHTNMLFSQNLFQDQGDASLYFGGTTAYDSLQISSNKFLGNSGGVSWASTSPLLNGVIQGNEFDGTVDDVPGVGDPLLNIGQSTNLTIEDNNFHDMDYTAFQVGMNGGSIVRNTFSHIYADPGVGFGDDFQLWGGQFGTEVSTNVTIADNTIHYNDIAGATNPTRGIRLRPPDTGAGIDGSTIHIHGNLFLNGGVLSNVPAVVNQGDQTKAVDATANWFGSPAGPGAGAASGNVNFTPWLLDPNGVTVTPSSGPTTGNTNVIIAGFGVTAATAVHFGSTPASSFTVNTDGTITAVAPPGAAGPVDVTVTRPAGTTVATTTDVFTYFAKPSITNLTPTSGLTSGGTMVTINGSGFTGATAVDFGANAGTSLHVLSDRQLTVTAPAGTAGPVNVTVTGPGGTSTAALFTYVTAGTPIVASVSPNSGSIYGGNPVTISGSGFMGATSVQFGTVTLLPNINFFVLSDNQISAVAPAGSVGPVDVRVTTAAGTSAIGSADTYSYFALGAPSVTSVVSSSGPATGGNTVTITGTGFTGATAVHFGTTSATSFTVVNFVTITAVVPAGTGIVDVTVTNAAGASQTSTADQYTYLAVPAVTNLSLSTGSTSGGTSVTITGSGFLGATAVNFGAIHATSFRVVNDSTITAVTPQAPPGPVDVKVTTAGGTSATSSADLFTFAYPTPAITSLSLNSGPTSGGTSLTITGSGFLGATTVKFGNTAAAHFTIVSDSQIIVTAPSGTSGPPVNVTVAGPGGTSTTTAPFTYVAPGTPLITSVSPNSGPAQSTNFVLLFGSGFMGATSIQFGTVTLYPNINFFGVSDGEIFVISPPEPAGTVDVTVTNAVGTSVSGPSDKYTYV